MLKAEDMSVEDLETFKGTFDIGLTKKVKNNLTNATE